MLCCVIFAVTGGLILGACKQAKAAYDARQAEANSLQNAGQGENGSSEQGEGEVTSTSAQPSSYHLITTQAGGADSDQAKAQADLILATEHDVKTVVPEDDQSPKPEKEQDADWLADFGFGSKA